MRLKTLMIYISFLVLFFTSSCKSLPGEEENKVTDQDKQPTTPIKSAVRAPRDFDFKSSNEIRIQRTLYYQGSPLANTPVAILDSSNNVILKVFTDNNGHIDTLVKIPVYIKSLFIEPLTPGTNIRINILLEPKTSLWQKTFEVLGEVIFSKAHASTISYEGNYLIQYLATMADANGVPNNIDSSLKKSCSANFLKRISASLPNGKSVKSNKPHYLSSAMETSTHITKTTDVWITLVDDGQSFKSTGSEQNNGWGNGDQDCPTNSCDSNNAENSDSVAPNGGKSSNSNSSSSPPSLQSLSY